MSVLSKMKVKLVVFLLVFFPGFPKSVGDLQLQFQQAENQGTLAYVFKAHSPQIGKSRSGNLDLTQIGINNQLPGLSGLQAHASP